MKKHLIWAMVCFTVSNNSAFANANKTAGLDSTLPIESLKNLTSLKNAKKIEYKAPEIFKFVTDKGTKAYYVNDTTLPIVDIRITFNAGSARDAELNKKFKMDLQGTSNLTALMLNKGFTKKEVTFSENDIISELENNGIQYSANAYKDMFMVSIRCLNTEKHIKKSVELVNNMLAFADFPAKNLKRVKAQQLLGIQQQSQRPASIASKTFYKTLYGSHPYARPTSGNESSVNNIQPKHLKAFKKSFLVSANANVAITGNVSYREAISIVNDLTADLAKGKAAKKLPKPKRVKGQHIHIDFDSNQTTFVAGQLGIDRKESKIHELMIANEILGGGDFSALLMNELRKKRGYTYGVYSSFVPMQVKGPFTVSFSTRADKATKALKVMKKTIRNYVRKGATTAQINETKESMVNQFPLGMATNSSINGMLSMMGFYNLPKEYLEDYVLNTIAPSAHSINVAFRKKINTRNMVIVTVGSEKP